MPVRRCLRAPFIGDAFHADGIDITDTRELRQALTRQRGLNAGMLPAQMSDADDCGA